jgi:hypothetical protein
MEQPCPPLLPVIRWYQFESRAEDWPLYSGIFFSSFSTVRVELHQRLVNNLYIYIRFPGPNVYIRLNAGAKLDA